jgi:predicted DNA-binding transcriptional regulator YafY
MASESEFSTRTRVIHLLRSIIERPNYYTKRALAERHNVHPDTIEGDFQAIQAAGFQLNKDERHRYAFVLEKPYQQLKDLLHFSEEDQSLLYQAIDSLPTNTERQQKLKQKLSSLYDFRQLGHAYLRKPYLTKVDALLQAQAEKKQVILSGYRSSNSNTISDRQVEPFHVSPPDDTVQTYDTDKKTVNHFRISRISRVKILDEPWQNEGHHNIRLTDPFRIVGNDQIMVQLRMQIGAYNELTERYPLTKGYIEEAEEGVYDFQCKVNQRFLGLGNFILGFYHQGIEILSPDSLRTHLQNEVQNMKF